MPEHLGEIRRRKETLVDKTIAAVKERLTAEIAYWDHRAEQLKEQELAGRRSARLNSGLARQRADELTDRLQKRMTELDQERKLSPLPPVIVGGAMIVSVGLLDRLKGVPRKPATFARDTERAETLAMQAVMVVERQLGFVPRDVHKENRGYDIESAIPGTGCLRFIEVKGRAQGAPTVTVTKNEILTALNKPDEFILAVVELDGDKTIPRYVRKPFGREPDFGVTSVNYKLSELIAKAEEPA